MPEEFVEQLPIDRDNPVLLACPECGSELLGNPRQCPACGALLTVNAGAKGGASSSFAGKHDGVSFFTRHQEVILLVLGIVAITDLSYGVYWISNPNSKLYFIGQLLGIQPPSFFSHNSIDHTTPFISILLPVIVLVIVATILSAQHGRLPFLRRIAGLNAIDEAIGRATEMGRPILFSEGLSGLNIVSLQALAVAAHVGRSAARYGTRLIIPVCDQSMLPITEQAIREVYTSEGRPEAYKPEDIRFLSDRQFAYAAGVTGIIHREKVGASFLFGQFYAEALILAENGQAVGAIQVAGTPDLQQTPFFVVSCDYTIIGDEYYAASAYLSREPTQLGSLVGQDIGKALLLLLIVVGIVWSIFTPDFPLKQWLGG